MNPFSDARGRVSGTVFWLMTGMAVIQFLCGQLYRQDAIAWRAQAEYALQLATECVNGPELD